jgi:hypothetical protein
LTVKPEHTNKIYGNLTSEDHLDTRALENKEIVFMLTYEGDKNMTNNYNFSCV